MPPDDFGNSTLQETLGTNPFGAPTSPAISDTNTSTQSQDLPSYYQGLDAHNYGNGNFAFTDPSTWSAGLSNTGKFILGAAYSGLNGFRNTGVAVANWFGADITPYDTAADLADIDTDLSAYYTAHKSAEDITGFILGSLIPGMGGVKLLNAGQEILRGAVATGEIGGTLGRATGLLTPASTFAKQAAQEITTAQASFKYINGNTIKALVAGVGQSTLEGAAFETAAVATQFKSPTLDDATGWDIAKDIALGGITAGAIGGAFEAAKTFGSIRKAISPADLAEKPFTFRTQLNAGSLPSARIVAAANDIAETPVAPIAGEDATKLSRLRDNKITALQNSIRTDIHAMVPGNDGEFANTVADLMKAQNADQVTANFQYAAQMGRLSSELDAEEEIAKATRANAKLKAGAIPADIPYKIGYVKLFGEGAGNIGFLSEPVTKNLADISTNAKEVQDTIASYGFTSEKLWNPVADGVDHLEAEARYHWADNSANIENEMTVHENDIPLQERILSDWQNQQKTGQPKLNEIPLTSINLVDNSGVRYAIENLADLLNHITGAKNDVANQLLARDGQSADLTAIAKTVNVQESYLASGKTNYDPTQNLFARQHYAQQYTQQLIDSGVRKESAGLVDTTMLPSWAKVSYNVTPMLDSDGKLLDGMAYLYARQQLLSQQIANVTSKYFGPLADTFTPLDSTDVLYANRLGAGPGKFSFANGNYGSTEAKVQAIGNATATAQRSVTGITRDTLQPLGYQLLRNSDAAIELSSISKQILSTSEQYVLDNTGQYLISRKLARYQDAIARGEKNTPPPQIQDGAPHTIYLQHPETVDAITADISLNGARIQSTRELRAVQGLEDQKDPTTFYPIRPNPRDYDHYAFVTDPSATAGSAGHTAMIHAADAATLEKLIDKVPSNFRVITKDQSEEYHKALGDYDYDRTLHENYINSSLQRAGISSSFFPVTDPQKIVTDWIQSHISRDNTLVREMVSAQYEPQFQEFRRLGEQYTGIASSKLPGFGGLATETVKDPYTNYIKTALNISQASEYPLLQGFNTIVDRTFSNAMNTISDIWDSAKSPADLAKVNYALQQAGVRSAYQDAATNLLANHAAGKGALSKFVNGANSILANLIIKLDPIYSINHTLGAGVLVGSETNSIFRMIKSGNSAAVGALAQLKDIVVPGTGDSITSPSKVIASAVRTLFQGGRDSLREYYTQQGWYGQSLDHFRGLLDDMALTGNESEVQLTDKLGAAFVKAKDLMDAGSRYTGTKFSIEANRFIAANVMDQIATTAVNNGLMAEADKISYINSFINRTQGNYLASQRPIIFQGPVGKAVGLFQTYQFNLMQQLFRHVGEGDAKDAAMLLGLQSTLYGLNGLPGFSYLNTHILGTMSGNPNHQDIYSQTYGTFGKTVGDWLLYGAPSNMLSTNLFSRGEINPRSVTIIPTNPADIPIVGAFTSFFGNLKNTAEKISAGGNVWESFLQGIEHNGLSRPLAGLAQELQAFGPGGYAYSTSSKGSILGTNDLFSIASLSRLAGGKPFDEAVANDAAFRMSAYAASDASRKDILTQAIKSSVIAGNIPSSASMDSFVSGYAALGGDQKRFNQFMLHAITSANKPQAEILMQKLKSPGNQNMQEVMGGRDPYNNLGY